VDVTSRANAVPMRVDAKRMAAIAASILFTKIHL
jgi:hypothetical protein